MIRWQETSLSDAAARLKSDSVSGLTQREAKKRFDEKKNSLLVKSDRDAAFYLRHFRSAVLPLLLLLAAILSLLTDKGGVGYLLLFASLLSFATLGLVYVKARSRLDGDEKKAAPLCRVIREGKLCVIPEERLVQGDVLLLRAGDFIPADCKLIFSEGLRVRDRFSEKSAVLHKEALEAVRCEDERVAPNLLFGGGEVVSGSCRAFVYGTAADLGLASYREVNDAPSLDSLPLLQRVKKLSSILSGVLISLLFVATVLGFFSFSPNDFLDNFILSSAFAASAMTEFYGIFAYIAASGALFSKEKGQKTRKDGDCGVLFKRADLFDEIASVDRLFLTADWFLVSDSLRLVSFSRPFGEARKLTDPLSVEEKFLLRDAALSLGEWYGASPLQRSGGIDEPDGADKPDSTDGEERLKNAFRRAICSLSFPDEGREYPLITYGRTKKGLYYGVILRQETPVVTLIGDSALLSLCTYRLADKELLPFGEEEEGDLICAVQQAETAREGVCETRYLAIAVLDALPENGRFDDAFFEGPSCTLTLEGVFLFEEALHGASVTALDGMRKSGLGVTLVCSTERDCRLAEKLSLPLSDDAELPEKGVLCAALVKETDDLLALVAASQAQGEVCALAVDNLEILRLPSVNCLTLRLMAWQNGEVPLEVTLDEGNLGAHLSAHGCDAARDAVDLPVAFARSEAHEVGGLASLAKGIRRVKRFFESYRVILAYLAFSLGLKLAPFIASLFSKTPILSPLAAVLWGLILDVAIVLSLAVLPHAERSGERRPDTRKRGLFASFWPACLVGIILGGAVTALILLLAF